MVEDWAWIASGAPVPFPRQMISSLGGQQYASEAISTPGLHPSLVSWVEDFSATWKGLLDDNFVQFYKAYGAINPDRAQVPPKYLEEFKQRRAVDCPDFWQIEEARACEACDVVPPPPPDPLALSAPPSGSRSEQAASTAEARAAVGLTSHPHPHPHP